MELVGLCAEVVGWLAEMHTAKKYPHGGVETSDGESFKINQWLKFLLIESCLLLKEGKLLGKFGLI